MKQTLRFCFTLCFADHASCGTYNRYEEKFDAYEAILDKRCAELMAKYLGKNLI